MPGACSGELSTLAPTISGCPADTELLLFCNVAAQQGGYAFRTWGTVRQCLISSSLVFGNIQAQVGQIGSIVSAGQTVITLNVANVIPDSLNVVLNGVVLDRNDSNQISYTVVYNANNVVITLNQAAQNNQTYVFTYAQAT